MASFADPRTFKQPAFPPEGDDWHPAGVAAELKKRGLSRSGLSIENGYHPTAAGKALKKPWPAMQTIIAAAIGVPASTIWPSRYSEGPPPALSTAGAPAPDHDEPAMRSRR